MVNVENASEIIKEKQYLFLSRLDEIKPNAKLIEFLESKGKSNVAILTGSCLDKVNAILKHFKLSESVETIVAKTNNLETDIKALCENLNCTKEQLVFFDDDKNFVQRLLDASCRAHLITDPAVTDDIQFESIGNNKLLGLPKIAFLASQKSEPESLARVRKWAESLDAKACIISGFKSELEFEVLKILAKRKNPLVWVIARGIYEELPYPYQKLVDAGRLLILSPFAQTQGRSTRDFAYLRNHLVINMADQIVVGNLSPGGMLERVLVECEKEYIFL